MSDTPGGDKPTSSGSDDDVPVYSDKVYRSVSGVAGGVFLLALLISLSIDAMVQGSGRAPITAAAVLVAAVPLIAAFTLWPQVRSGEKRLLVRNPFRTIDAPWGTVESLTAALSVELRAGGRKFVVWALPVSMRQRKRANKQAMLAAGDRSITGGGASRRDSGRLGFGLMGGGGRDSRGGGFGRPAEDTGPTQAWADKAVVELNERAEMFRAERGAVADEGAPAVTGQVKVTWTWPIVAPLAVGIIALIVILATG
ncbi:PH domain-containing protein [Streptacidiphilus sp. MAP5-3]|uniref:PH domain-containing protein n=1 Tax=unclassified Streptacidiphilus TaxID=2643834 RepID=UPI003511D07F